MIIAITFMKETINNPVILKHYLEIKISNLKQKLLDMQGSTPPLPRAVIPRSMSNAPKIHREKRMEGTQQEVKHSFGHW